MLVRLKTVFFFAIPVFLCACSGKDTVESETDLPSLDLGFQDIDSFDAFEARDLYLEDASLPDVSITNSWRIIRFAARHQEMMSPMSMFHSTPGETVLEIHSTGKVILLPFQECAGQHSYLEGELSTDDHQNLTRLINGVPDTSSGTQTLCDECIGCGFEEILIINDEFSASYSAIPAFHPLNFCNPDGVVNNIFSSELKSLAEFLRSYLLYINSLNEINPDIVWLGVFDERERIHSYKPNSIEWPFESVQLANLRALLSWSNTFTRFAFYGDDAARLLEFCREGRSTWPSDLTGLDTNICDPQTFFVAKENNIDYFVSCEPALESEIP